MRRRCLVSCPMSRSAFNLELDATANMVRKCLQNLGKVLSECGETQYAAMVCDIVRKDDGTLHTFLMSNELWGGPGSIADQAGAGTSRESRRKIEWALTMLGNEQLQCGVVNPRTSSWVKAFEEWAKNGI